MTDTNQASELLELCKEVYRRHQFWAGTDMIFGKEVGRDWRIMPLTFRIPKRNRIPLYTSDYLLEKLPSTIKNEFDGDDDYLILYKKSGSWYADYMGQFLRCKGDTPLIALLRLTIVLSKEGELK